MWEYYFSPDRYSHISGSHVSCEIELKFDITVRGKTYSYHNFTFRLSWVVTIYKCSMPLVCLSRINFD